MSRKLKHSRFNRGTGISEDAKANAAARHDSTIRALAGAETVPAVVDSSGEPIENASPLSQDERQAGKNALR